MQVEEHSLGPFYCNKCTMLRSGVLSGLWRQRCDHAEPQNNPPGIAVQTSPMNFWKVAPLDSAVDWWKMRHCSEAYPSAHRALVFTDELTSFLGAFFFFASARTSCSVVDKLHQLDDVPPRLRRLRSGRRLWSCSRRDVFRCICLHLCRNCAFRPSSVSSGSNESDANTMRTPTSTAALPLGQCHDNSPR